MWVLFWPGRPPSFYHSNWKPLILLIDAQPPCHPSSRALANLGLGTGQIIAAFADKPEFLLVGAFIDGCTSYSFPLAQAYIADVTPPEKLPEAYGAFQVRYSPPSQQAGVTTGSEGVHCLCKTCPVKGRCDSYSTRYQSAYTRITRDAVQ